MGCGSSSQKLPAQPVQLNQRFIDITGPAKIEQDCRHSQEHDDFEIKSNLVVAKVSTELKGDGW